MALTIDNPEADRLARELAAKTGESVENAVLNALREKMAREKKWEPTRFPTNDGSFLRAVKEAQAEIAKLPVLDDRSADELLGYDEWGLPH